MLTILSVCYMRVCLGVFFFSQCLCLSLSVFLPFVVSLPVFISVCLFFFTIFVSLHLCLYLLSLSLFLFLSLLPSVSHPIRPQPPPPSTCGLGALPSQVLTPGSHSKLPSPGLSCPPPWALEEGGEGGREGSLVGPPLFAFPGREAGPVGLLTSLGRLCRTPALDAVPGSRGAWLPWFRQPPARQPGQHATAAPIRALGPCS